MKYNVYASNEGLVIRDENDQLYVLAPVNGVEEGFDQSTFDFQDQFVVREERSNPC